MRQMIENHISVFHLCADDDDDDDDVRASFHKSEGPVCIAVVG